MSYGFELRNPAGTRVQMSTNDFGLMIADVFDVSPGTSSSKTYPELAWHNNVYAEGTTNISGTVFSRSLMSHSFVNITISVNSSNVPTINWAYHNSVTACLGGDNDDTSNWSLSSGSSNAHLCLGGDKRPDVRIIVLVG